MFTPDNAPMIYKTHGAGSHGLEHLMEDDFFTPQELQVMSNIFRRIIQRHLDGRPTTFRVAEGSTDGSLLAHAVFSLREL